VLADSMCWLQLRKTPINKCLTQSWAYSFAGLSLLFEFNKMFSIYTVYRRKFYGLYGKFFQMFLSFNNYKKVHWFYGVIMADRGGLDRLAAWHLLDGPVGPPARWATTSNVEGRSGTGEGAQCPLARGGGGFPRINYLPGPRVPSYASAYGSRSACT